MTSDFNLSLAVNDVMPYFLIWSQRFQLAISYIFLTITFEMGLLINVSQDDSTPFTSPVNCYPKLV